MTYAPFPSSTSSHTPFPLVITHCCLCLIPSPLSPSPPTCPRSCQCSVSMHLWIRFYFVWQFISFIKELGTLQIMGFRITILGVHRTMKKESLCKSGEVWKVKRGWGLIKSLLSLEHGWDHKSWCSRRLALPDPMNLCGHFIQLAGDLRGRRVMYPADCLKF